MTPHYSTFKKPVAGELYLPTTERLVAWGARLSDEFNAAMAGQYPMSDEDHALWIAIYEELETRARAGDMDAADEIRRNEIPGGEGP